MRLSMYIAPAKLLLALTSCVSFSLADEPPAPDKGDSNQETRQIANDADASFAGAVRIDFDQDPTGAALPVHTDVSKTYVPLGAKFSTSVETSFVGAQGYRVRSPRAQPPAGSGQSAAMDEPIYTGEMTIRFCKPGDESVPATVNAVGFWIAHVVPKGSSLQAFDASDAKLGEVFTEKTNVDFLGITSTRPIAYIKVVSSKEDSDFAIDDLVFSKPKPIGE